MLLQSDASVAFVSGLLDRLAERSTLPSHAQRRAWTLLAVRRSPYSKALPK